MGTETAVFASSDHGFAPPVVCRQCSYGIEERGAAGYRADLELPRRRGADKVKACWAGGTAQLYISKAVIRVVSCPP
jgi:hypothetical protein